jgi:hypothetical protein
MTISRGQMPRQLYGLGSFVKSIGKGVKKAVKGVKSLVGSDLGKAALLIGGGMIPFGSTQTSLFSRIANTPFVSGILQSKAAGKIGNVLQDVAIGTGIAGLTDYLTKPDVDPSQQRTMGRTEEELNELEAELRKNYENLGYSKGEIDLLVEQGMKEYGRDMNAYGGRIGYARGDMAEQNAMQASGIMGLPLNENPAGVTELDLRETGGFIPPVGVKEKADDIPAMLSNNEFVFTADAVRGMGGGDVNKGAERMYSMMKQLENGGRV